MHHILLYILVLLFINSSRTFGIMTKDFIRTSRAIEIDLREMLGEKDLPPAIQPQNNILM